MLIILSLSGFGSGQPDPTSSEHWYVTVYKTEDSECKLNNIAQ